MNQSDLIVPKQLLELIEKGIWPRTIDEANKQHIKTIIPLTKLKEFAPDEDGIYFYTFPFTRISDALMKQYDYWINYGAIDQIDPNLALIIADFGLGSDTLLILDYRENINSPTLYRLKWGKVNHWVTFCKIVGFDML